MYPTPGNLTGFLLGFRRERWRKAIGMTVGSQVWKWHCRDRPETGRGRHQILGKVGGRSYLKV